MWKLRASSHSTCLSWLRLLFYTPFLLFFLRITMHTQFSVVFRISLWGLDESRLWYRHILHISIVLPDLYLHSVTTQPSHLALRNRIWFSSSWHHGNYSVVSLACLTLPGTCCHRNPSAFCSFLAGCVLQVLLPADREFTYSLEMDEEDRIIRLKRYENNWSIFTYRLERKEAIGWSDER